MWKYDHIFYPLISYKLIEYLKQNIYYLIILLKLSLLFQSMFRFIYGIPYHFLFYLLLPLLFITLNYGIFCMVLHSNSNFLSLSICFWASSHFLHLVLFQLVGIINVHLSYERIRNFAHARHSEDFVKLFKSQHHFFWTFLRLVKIHLMNYLPSRHYLTLVG